VSDEEYSDWYNEHAWSPARFADLIIETDLTPAEWLEPLLVPQSFEVWMTAPKGYEAYARIFFPFVRTGLDAGGEWHEQHIRWTDIARENGKLVHALMERETISRSPTGEDATERCAWNLSPEQLAALMSILVRHTTSTSGWFLLWDGFGDLNDDVFNAGVPKVSHAMRDFYLLRGPLESYTHFSNDPSYWWPDDRAWCVGTEIDFDSTLVAATDEVVTALLAEPELEVIRVEPNDRLDIDGDVLNS